MTGTVYGKEFLHKKGLSCVEAYVEIKAGHRFVMLRFVNSSNDSQILYPGKKVASLEMPDGSELLEEFSNHKTEQKGKEFGVNTVNEGNVFDCESFDSALLSQNEKRTAQNTFERV